MARPPYMNGTGEPRTPQSPVPGPRAQPTRRLVLAAGGVSLLGACGPSPSELAARARGVAPVPAPRVRSAPPITGAPFPTDTAPASAGPGDSHSGTDTPPPDTAPTTPGQQNDPPPPAGKPQFYVHEGDKAIALTVDDGPDSVYTPQVLALLAQYKIQATFCMLGKAAATHTGLVQEVLAAGHLVANHTYTHANLSKADVNTVRSEITRANDALAAAGAKPPTFFRAPYGAWGAPVFQVCQELNLRPLDWSVDPRDWSRPGADHIVDTVLGHTHTGSIILEHDGGGDRSQTVAALGRFLPRLLEQGYRFVQP